MYVSLWSSLSLQHTVLPRFACVICYYEKKVKCTEYGLIFFDSSLNLNLITQAKRNVLTTGADLGGGGGRPPLRDSTPCRPKGSPFDTSSEIHFWPTDPKIFLKAPSAPIYTSFEGERAPKKTRFCQNFSKSAQKRLFYCFFKNLPAMQKILPK